MNKKIKSIIYSLAFLSIIILMIFNNFRVEEINQDYLESFKEFDNVKLINNDPLLYEVYKGEEKVGYLVFGEKYGYQSDVVITTLVDYTGEIIRVDTYSEDETPAFYGKIINKDFFNRNFKEDNIKDGFFLGENVDGITGATISSTAITKAVQEGTYFLSSNYLNIEQKKEDINFTFGETEIAILIMFLIVIFAIKTKNKKLRYVALTYSIIIMGFKYALFISYSQFVSLALGNAPNSISNFRWYFLLLGALIFIITTGKNVYCSYICPFGALQEMEFKLAKLDFFKVSPKVSKYLAVMPSIVAYIAFVFALITTDVSGVSYEPFSLVYGRNGIGIQWALLPIILIFSLFRMRFYCNYGCPVGVTLKLITKARKWVRNIWKRKKA